MHFAIESSGTQQSLIQILRAIGRRDHYHAIVALLSVYRGQQCIDRLLHFPVGIELAALAETIDLID